MGKVVMAICICRCAVLPLYMSLSVTVSPSQPTLMKKYNKMGFKEKQNKTALLNHVKF